MRTMEFTIENNGNMLEIGQKVDVIEGRLPASYYYTIEHAIGMSGNYTTRERLNTRKGEVLEIKKTAKFNIAVLGFEE